MVALLFIHFVAVELVTVIVVDPVAAEALVPAVLFLIAAVLVIHPQ